jgi:glutamate-1-semialdehyde 2,1-aminomutase
VAAALATIERLEDGEVYRHIFRLGERMRVGLEELVTKTGAHATVTGYGSLFSLCFVDHPLTSYDDLRDDDVELFLAYRRGLIARGVFEVPDIDGYRSHISAAHTDEDVERSLEAAAESLTEALQQR